MDQSVRNKEFMLEAYQNYDNTISTNEVMIAKRINLVKQKNLNETEMTAVRRSLRLMLTTYT